MTHPDELRIVELSVFQVTPATCWTFVEIETRDGWRGVGEATLSGQEDAVIAAVAALAGEGAIDRGGGDLPIAAARSAMDQARCDAAARRGGRSLADMLGDVRRERVPVYANINRRVVERTPAAFADNARAAISAGHRALKLAPFDEVSHRDDGAGAIAKLRAGLARIAAVRQAVGPEPQIMVDCHWRLNRASSDYAIDAAAELGVSWIECPFPETPDHLAAIVRLRRRANARGILLAGLETAIGVEGFRPFIDARAYDVMMPDAKYVGGLAEMLRLAETMREAGIAFSPHNPSGPICHAVSLHVCAVVAAVHSLEIQFDETPFFAALIGRELQETEAGTIAVPTGPGIGVSLRRDLVERHRVRHWTSVRGMA